MMITILNVSSDLSSNSIEIIEGLGCLRKLEVLNLANNRISVIENMDTLEELSHFNIGNNRIEQLDNVTTFSCQNMPDILCFYSQYNTAY